MTKIESQAQAVDRRARAVLSAFESDRLTNITALAGAYSSLAAAGDAMRAVNTQPRFLDVDALAEWEEAMIEAAILLGARLAQLTPANETEAEQQAEVTLDIAIRYGVDNDMILGAVTKLQAARAKLDVAA
jgi:hypothetical protein